MNQPDKPDDESQWSEIASWLKARDPAKAAPPGLSERRKRRLVWLMQRPFFAFLALHHRATAAAGAILAVAAVIAVLFAIKAREQTVLPPVRVVFEDPSSAEAPDLEPDLPPADVPGDLPETPSELIR